MARITALRVFLTAFSLKISGNLILDLEVEDKLIPENEGRYLWILDEQGSSLEIFQDQQELQAAQRTWTLKADITEIASWLFGYENLKDLWPDMPEEMKNDWRRSGQFRESGWMRSFDPPIHSALPRKSTASV